MNFWTNTDRFVVSQLKAYYGTAATADNEFGYAMHPRLPQSAPGAYENWSWAYIFDHMYRGDMEGFFSFGMNPVSNGPHSRKAIAALAKLDGGRGELRAGDGVVLASRHPRARRSEAGGRADGGVPAARGQLRREGRQLRELGAVDPVEVEGRGSTGEARADQEIVARIFLKVRELYQQEGGTYPDPVRNLNWWYSNPAQPSLDEVCKEINGWALQDIRDPPVPSPCARGSSSDGSSMPARMVRRCRGTGSTSGPTPMPAT